MTATVADRYGVDDVSPVSPPRPVVDAPRRVVALDGLRGVSLLLVIAFHEGWLRGGFLGLELFFVVSGYVITTSLLPRLDGTRERLGRFWARRVRRLLPAMLLLLVAAQLWVRFGAEAGHVRLLNGQTQGALAYVGNWYAIFAGTGYWEAGAEQTPLLHLWSLAVEEQFYLLWPLLLAGAFALGKGEVRRWMAPATFGLAAVGLALTPIVYALAGPDRAYYGTETRVGSIFLGAGLALLPLSGLLSIMQRSARLLPLALGWFAFALFAVGTHSPALYQGGLALTGLASLVVVGAVVRDSRSRMSRLLANPVLVWIGVRSYGMYLWAWPVQVVLTHSRTGLDGATLLLVKAIVILALTTVSYRLVELPIRRGTGRRFPAAALVVIVGLAGATMWLQPATPVNLRAGAVVASGTGGAGSLRVMVIGDSWARSVGVGITAADAGDRHSVLNDGMASCGLLRRPTRSADEVRPVDPACAAWPTRWAEELAGFAPNAVVLTTGNWDQAPVEIDGVFVRPTDRRYAPAFRESIDRAIEVLASGGAPVYVTTVVEVGDPDQRRWAARVNALLRDSVSRHSEARVLDLHGLLCNETGCPDRLDGAEVYDDTMHLTPRWERRVGSWILARLEAEVGGDTEQGVQDQRRRLAAQLLPTPEQLLGGAAADSEYPHPALLFGELLPGGADRDRESIALAAARVDRGADGAVMRNAVARFPDDATPDRLAMRGYRALLAEGWTRVPLDVADRVLLQRGGDVLLFVRMPRFLGVFTSDDPDAASRLVAASAMYRR